MTGEAWTVNSDKKLAAFCKHVADLYAKHKHVTFKWTTGQQRTAEQNAALHLWCERVAVTLNDAGLELVVPIPTGKEWTIPWSMHTVKHGIWRPVQQALTGKESTTQPSAQEYVQIHEVIHSRFAMHHGIALPAWPTRELAG